MKHFKRRLGFSLIEVVVSVGIFAVAIVGVIGLLAPTTKNVAGVADTDAATRAIAAIQFYLKESTSTDPRKISAADDFTKLQAAVTSAGTGYVFYATHGGDKVCKASDTTIANKDRFFEFELVRNTALSPNVIPNLDKDAGFLALTINLRWPAYLPNGVKVTDDSQKSVMVVPTAVAR